MKDRTFAKYSACKGDPAWRRGDASLRAVDIQEILAACEDLGIDRSLRAYSTIGPRDDVDLALLSQSPSLDDIHAFRYTGSETAILTFVSMSVGRATGAFDGVAGAAVARVPSSLGP